MLRNLELGTRFQKVIELLFPDLHEALEMVVCELLQRAVTVVGDRGICVGDIGCAAVAQRSE